MQMPGRMRMPQDYRYGFNGKEKDGEAKGEGNSIHFEFREYDPRIARFGLVDPRAAEYAWQSPYCYHRNNPIALTDFLGLGDPPGPNMSDRHIFENLNFWKGVTKNSYLLEAISMEDLQKLYNEAITKGVKTGEVTLSNGQTWFIEQSSGKFHPVSGNGIITLTQQEVSFLRVAKDQIKNGTSVEQAFINMTKAMKAQGYTIGGAFEGALTKLGTLKNVSQSTITSIFAPLAPQTTPATGLQTAAQSRFAGKTLQYVKWGGRTLIVVAIAVDVYEVYNSENKARTITKIVGGWTGGMAAASVTGAGLAAVGIDLAGPYGWIPHGVITIGAGVGGYFLGQKITTTVYDWIFTKEE